MFGDIFKTKKTTGVRKRSKSDEGESNRERKKRHRTKEVVRYPERDIEKVQFFKKKDKSKSVSRKGKEPVYATTERETDGPSAGSSSGIRESDRPAPNAGDPKKAERVRKLNSSEIEILKQLPNEITSKVLFQTSVPAVKRYVNWIKYRKVLQLAPQNKIKTLWDGAMTFASNDQTRFDPTTMLTEKK